MKVQILFLAVLAVFESVNTADINILRKEALAKIDKNAAETIELGQGTNKNVTLKSARISQIDSMFLQQGEKIKCADIVDFFDEVNLFYKRAEILENKNNVYSCIANEANNGESAFKDNHWTFYSNARSTTSSSSKEQETKIKAWRTDMNAQEAAYRKKYIDSNIQITTAKEESKITAAVNSFANATSTFQKNIQQIENTINSVQLLFLDKVQALLANLRSSNTATKTNYFSKIKNCFNLKSLFFQLK